LLQRIVNNLVYLNCVGSQEVLFATPQVIVFEEHFLLISSLNALKNVIQKLEYEMENKNGCLAPLFDRADSIKVKQIYDPELWVDLLLLLIPRDVAKELNLPWVSVKVRREGSMGVVKGVFEDSKLRELKLIYGNARKEGDVIIGSTGQLSKGANLYVVGGRFLKKSTGERDYIPVVKRCSVLESSSLVFPAIGSSRDAHTKNEVSNLTVGLDIPFNFSLAGAPALTYKGELVGFLTGISDNGYMKLLPLYAFYEIVERVISYDGTFIEALEHPVFTKYKEIVDSARTVEKVEEPRDLLQGIDDFVINFDEKQKEEREGNKGKVVPSIQVLNRALKNNRIIEETEEFVYIGGLTEGDIVEIAKESVVPVYIMIGDKAIGNGTGFIYKQKIYKGRKRSELFFLTNLHVIQPFLSISAEGKLAQVVIRLGDNYLNITKVVAPRGALLYLGKDLRYEPYDFCVLIAEVDTDKEFKFFHIRKGLNIRETDKVIAIGYPIHTVTTTELSYSEGIISHIYDDTNPDPNLKNVLQITAPLNPGNSGGPLITPSLQVVGINTRSFNVVPGGKIIQNMNIAIRIDHVVDTLSNKNQLEFIRLEKLSAILRKKINNG